MNILCVQGKGRHLFCGRVWKSLQKFVQKCKERGFLCSKWALGDRALITDFSCPYRQHRPCVYSSVEWPYAEVFQLCSQKCCTSLLEGRVYLVSNLPTENTFTLKHLFFFLELSERRMAFWNRSILDFLCVASEKSGAGGDFRISNYPLHGNEIQVSRCSMVETWF